MAVYRVHKNNNYTVISNVHLMDKNLSWKATGILSVMLSLPENWDYSVKGLEILKIDKESCIRTGLKELEKFGYLIRKPIKIKGKIIDWEYNIFETPIFQKPFVENPQLEIPLLEKPLVENQAQLNTKEIITKELNTNLQNTNTYTKQDIEIKFNEFWNIYPKKQDKKKALIIFEKYMKQNIDCNLMLDGAKKYAKWIIDNKKQEYIKMPTTWLNGECWNDELVNQSSKSDTTDNTTKKYAGINYI